MPRVRPFRKFYQERYGPQHFYVPVAVLLIVAAVGNFYLAKSLQTLVDSGAKPASFDVAAAALAGAYTFVCWELFSRMQRLTLTRGDVLRAALRLAVALPIGFAFGTLLNASLAPFVAFAMGAFPLQIITVILQRQMKKRLELELDAKAARDQVFLLTGIDTPIAERIEDADITTITQLAWADPLQLTMRTNLQFAFVIDIISQALAWVYFEKKLQPLGVIGLRGAVEIRSVLEDIGMLPEDDEPETHVRIMSHEVLFRSGGVQEIEQVVELDSNPRPTAAKPKNLDSDAAKAAVAAAAKIVEVDEKALMYALIQIGKDPTVEFLAISWRSLTSGG